MTVLSVVRVFVSDTTPVHFPFTVAVVAGTSMQPQLYDGDCVVIRRGSRARIGDVVLARRPDRISLLVVKRVREVLSDGDVWLAGDNPAASDDSRLFGPVSRDAIEGRVLWRYRPLRRRTP
jgi:nickel-type superoxide dismutase maturation protease